MAFTKYVHNGGNITQNHSGLNIKKATVPTMESNVYNQYTFTDADSDVISFIFLYL
jgi:hypothetical protein